MAKLRVGQWFLKFDQNQQEAFKRIYNGDVQKARKFLTACKKHFDRTDLFYVSVGRVNVDGQMFAWSYGTNQFYKLGE